MVLVGVFELPWYLVFSCSACEQCVRKKMNLYGGGSICTVVHAQAAKFGAIR